MMIAGILVATSLGGAMTVLGVGLPFTTAGQSAEAATELPSDDHSPQLLRMTADSSVVHAAPDDLVQFDVKVENPRDTAIEEVVSLRVDADRDGAFESTVGKRTIRVPAQSGVTLNLSMTMSRLGPGTFDYVVETGDGETDFVRGSFTLEPTEFVISGIDAPLAIRGEPADITVTFTNVGDFPGSRSVEVAVDQNLDGTYQASEHVSTNEISIDDGIQRNSTIRVPTESIQPGVYPVRVSVGSESSDAELRIRRPATLEIQTMEESQNVVPGEPFEITVHVKNPGDVAGRGSVSISGLSSRLDKSRNVSLGPGNKTEVAFRVNTTGLDPGYHRYEVTTGDETVSSPLRLFRPANYRINFVNASPSVTQGTPVNVSVGLTNVGDLSGNRTVALHGPTGTQNRSVEIPARQAKTVTFTVDTATIPRGNYTFKMLADRSGERVKVRVRAPRFVVSSLSGTGTYTIGDELEFSADVRNAGDAEGVQRVELRIDEDDDDSPEPIGISKEVSLAPGERTSVKFTVDRNRWADVAPATSQIGSHIVGIFTNETNVTGVFAVEPSESNHQSQDLVSRDEITQEKYGLYYSELSKETERQVDELYTRQPFADGLVITEVLTREEIAREQFGQSVVPGEPFNFTNLDVQVQQDVEDTFDTQFTSEEGDRIESWNELARMKYGQPYDQLTAEQKEAVKEAYWDQFEDTG
jgi:hypothetical protein